MEEFLQEEKEKQDLTSRIDPFQMFSRLEPDCWLWQGGKDSFYDYLGLLGMVYKIKAAFHTC